MHSVCALFKWSKLVMIYKRNRKIVDCMWRIKEFRVFASRFAMLCDSCASMYIFAYRSLSI